MTIVISMHYALFPTPTIDFFMLQCVLGGELQSQLNQLFTLRITFMLFSAYKFIMIGC